MTTMTLIEAMMKELEASPNDMMTHTALADLYLERADEGDETLSRVHRMAAAGDIVLNLDTRSWVSSTQRWDAYVRSGLGVDTPTVVKPSYVQEVREAANHGCLQSKAYLVTLERCVGWGWSECAKGLDEVLRHLANRCR